MSVFVSDPLGDAHRHASGALAWWLGELRSAFADAARWVRSLDRNALTLEAGEQQWILRRKHRLLGKIDWQSAGDEGRRQRLRELTIAVGRSAALCLEIPPERLLSKVIDLPARAHAQLDRILSFEIARHFPFPAERVFYRYRVIGRPGTAAAAPSVSVEIVAVPRDVVASIAGELAAAGLRVDAIALRAAPGTAPLFLGREAPDPPQSTARTSRLLAAGVAMMALIAAVSWPLAQQVRLAAMEREVAALKPTAEAALRARTERQRARGQAAAIAQLLAERPPLIAVLDVLSRVVPDGSWLTSLSISGREVVLQGLSPSAAAIALALGRDPHFGSVVFRSPVARDAATGLEHFEFGATLKAAER